MGYTASKTNFRLRTSADDKIEAALETFDVISLNKARMKWIVLFHFALSILMFIRLSNELLTAADMQVPSAIRQLRLPKPALWELAWLPSIMASIFAYLSLKKNNSSLMWQALLGHVIMGLAPVCYGIYQQYPAFIKFLKGKSAVPAGGAVPFGPLTWAWLVISLQVHLFQLYFAQRLLFAWRSATARKSK